MDIKFSYDEKDWTVISTLEWGKMNDVFFTFHEVFSPLQAVKKYAMNKLIPYLDDAIHFSWKDFLITDESYEEIKSYYLESYKSLIVENCDIEINSMNDLNIWKMYVRYGIPIEKNKEFSKKRVGIAKEMSLAHVENDVNEVASVFKKSISLENEIRAFYNSYGFFSNKPKL